MTVITSTKLRGVLASALLLGTSLGGLALPVTAQARAAKTYAIPAE